SFGERASQNAAAAIADGDAGLGGELFRQRGMKRPALHAELEKRAWAQGLGLRREKTGRGARGLGPRMAAVDHKNVATAPRELASERTADHSGAHDRDVGTEAFREFSLSLRRALSRSRLAHRHDPILAPAAWRGSRDSGKPRMLSLPG